MIDLRSLSPGDVIVKDVVPIFEVEPCEMVIACHRDHLSDDNILIPSCHVMTLRIYSGVPELRTFTLNLLNVSDYSKLGL